MYYQIFSKIYKRAAKKMCFQCQQFIKKGSKILDLGCGSGIVGETFRDFFQAEVIGVDIRNVNISSLPFKFYDGRKLPFSEKSFDIVLINYVLHHTEEPEVILEEAKRVAKDKIIVFEDLPEGFFSKIICKIHEFSFNKLFKIKSQASFNTEKDWEEIFKKIGLALIFKQKRYNFPVKKELFVVGV